MFDYTRKIENVYDSVSSININIEEDGMTQGCLGGFKQMFDPIRTTILVREKTPSFFDRQSMLLVKENNMRTKSKTSKGQILFPISEGG